jgi:hypothetical protein
MEEIKDTVDTDIKTRKILSQTLEQLSPVIDRILWTCASDTEKKRRVHSRIKQKSLDRAVALVRACHSLLHRSKF